jgi:hypothetical protein
VLVEFYAPDDEEKKAVATAAWDGHDVTITCADDDLRDRLARGFRRTPVVTDDASYRRLGTSGDSAIQPGSLEWFRAAAQVRAGPEAGLAARFVPGVVVGGFDPAAGYRTFEDQIERLDARTRD